MNGMNFKAREQLSRDLDKLRWISGIVNSSPAVAFLWNNTPGWPVEFVTENVKDLFGAQQVLLNLLQNAAHALSSRKEAKENARIIVRTALDQGWARIEVEDNGPGMPEHVRRRVFEPFFASNEWNGFPCGENT